MYGSSLGVSWTSIMFVCCLNLDGLLILSHFLVLQSAGNRSTAMSNIKAVKVVGWDVSAIGNGMPLAPTLLTGLFIFTDS